ncbi:MAG: flagellar hook-associated protein [Spirochaetaceae bacterium]|nr:MAG: flagellar hook-associated protein [Spirochaetaceae bacterium]
MSDIVIPGVSNRYFSQEQIEEMVELEAAPIRRLERQIDEQEKQKQSWQEVGRRISAVQGAARNLFGVDSPFRNRVAESSNETIVSATASRSAQEERADIIVKQIASPDRFGSDPLEGDITVPEGNYTFMVGEREHSLRFRGGDLESFATAVNRRMGEHLRARVVKDTPSTSRFIIEARQEGSANSLSFTGDSEKLALQLGIITENKGSEFNIALPEGAETLTVASQQTQRINLPSQNIKPEFRLRMEMKITSRDYSNEPAPSPPPGPNLPDTGQVSLRGITVRDEGLAVDLPDMGPPPPPPLIEDNDILYLIEGQRPNLIASVAESGEFESIDVPLSDYISNTADSLEIRNRNTHKDVAVRNIQLYDPNARGDYIPKNPLSTAGDAIINLDGIDFTRESNTIEDVIPGTTLNLRRVSDEPVEISVGPDRESSKDAIIEFIGYYNQLFTEILILSRGTEDVVDEIAYFTPEEREDAMSRLGMMQGDSTLNQIIRALKTATAAPYPTELEQEVALLAQIGISTSSANQGGGFDMSRLRGYLQINENLLDEALENRFTAVRQLFGNDTDGDGSIDSGVAYQVDRMTRPYVQTGGIIATRTATIDSSIDRSNDTIETYSERLEDYEAKLRSDFAKMEGAIQQMESNAQRFENMNPGNGN